MYYQCGENKAADHLCSYCTAYLNFVFACAKIQFSHDVSHFNNVIMSMFKVKEIVQ